jgi:hypothetical protein
MRAQVTRVTARLPEEQVAMVEQAAADLKEAGTVEHLHFEPIDDDTEAEVSVILAEDA